MYYTRQGLSIVGYGTSQVVQNTPGSSPLFCPVSGHGAGFYGTYVVELVCINLGELTALVGGKVFERAALAALTCPVHS